MRSPGKVSAAGAALEASLGQALDHPHIVKTLLFATAPRRASAAPSAAPSAMLSTTSTAGLSASRGTPLSAHPLSASRGTPTGTPPASRGTPTGTPPASHSAHLPAGGDQSSALASVGGSGGGASAFWKPHNAASGLAGLGSGLGAASGGAGGAAPERGQLPGRGLRSTTLGLGHAPPFGLPSGRPATPRMEVRPCTALLPPATPIHAWRSEAACLPGCSRIRPRPLG
jgi:hypothetical protein